MKRTALILSLFLVLVLVGSAIAGWVTSGNNMHSDLSGNVGIGTNNPQRKLDVIASSSDSTNEWAPAIYGQNKGAGDGVYGWSQNRHGVFGTTKSANSAGVYGFVETENGKAVFGLASGNYGEAVRGKGTGTHTEGVMGEALGPQGNGVSGYGKLNDFFAWGPGTDYGSASSIRWKSDIKPIDDPLDKVLRLQGVYFTWDEEHGGERDVGMIAEEVGEILPEIVSYEPDGQYTTGMDYSRLTPLLIEGVKELSKENAELKNRLTKLETIRKDDAGFHDRIRTLEALVDQLANDRGKVSDELQR